jgi:hypothetical protein
MVEIEIYDLNGRLVLAKDQINHRQYDLNTAILPSGMYLGKIRFEKGIITEKIVIKK